jgi:hypothetical protein
VGIRQESFGAGEVSPRLHGQPGAAEYARGLRRGRNVVVTKEGSLASRPGMRFCGQVAGNSPDVRLERFVYSDAFAYVLEFTPGHLRLWHAGALVVDGAAVTVDVATPYAAGELHQLRFAQSGDVVYITHRNHSARVLTRTSATVWALTVVDFSRPSPPTANPWGIDNAASPGIGVSSAGNPAIAWRWKVTQLLATSQGGLDESAAFDATAQVDFGPYAYTPLANPYVGIRCTADFPVVLTRENGLVYSDSARYLVYRGLGGRYGLVGETVAGSKTFTDFGNAPDYSYAPPLGENPVTQEPGCVAFHEERLALGGTTERPSWWAFSTTGDYHNFDSRSPARADMALQGELPSRQREETRGLLSYGDTLLAFTDAAVWALAGGGGAPLTYDSATVRRLLEAGANWAAPVQAGDAVLFARARGRGVSLLTPSEEGSRLGVRDVSAHAGHLFGPWGPGLPGVSAPEAVQLAYQEEPWGVLWAVLSNGRLLSLTANQERGVLGWTWHDTYGWVKSVACVPEDGEDAVYVAVVREFDTASGPAQTFVQVERMKGFVVDDTDAVADAVCLDAAATFTGTLTSVTPGERLGLGPTVSDGGYGQVYALADGHVLGPLAPDMPVGTTWALGDTYSTVHIGFQYLVQAESLDVAQARGAQKAVERLFLDVYAARGLWAGRTWDKRSDFVEVLRRRAADAYDTPLPLRSERVEVRIRTGWGTDGRVCVEQREPLPFVLVGLEREVALGG